MNDAMDSAPTPDEVDDNSEALAALFASPLFAGPDPSVVSDVQSHEEAEATQWVEDAEVYARVQQIYTAIVSRAPEHKVQPSLDRVRRALDLMGNPQESFRTIHITGTNGKTSTARIVEALLRERGLRTGRFTSPHLSSVRERISIDGQAISATDFVQTWDDVEPFIDMVDTESQAAGGPRMSFFEVFTVMAYSAFAMAPVDVAVVEVGMGGRWDATNVIDADVAMIMPISHDHEKWLGHELTDIAFEKVGIVKPGSTLILAPQDPEVRAMAYEQAHRVQANIVDNFEVLSREAAVGGQLISLRTPAAVYEDIPLAMLGAYQAQNAAAALSAVEAFFGGAALPANVVEHALMSTSSPGRLEVVKSSPLVIVDAAHNPAGARVTREGLEEYFPGPRVAVFSAMADKDVAGILTELEPAFHSIVLTEMVGDRAMDIDELQEIAVDIFGEDRVRVETELLDAVAAAVDIAETVDPDAIAPASVTVLGSIMLAGHARELLGASIVDMESHA
ncbi:bifunctional folylpolyglutamate synthase/dihydrofolate synthase [Arcanobacterium phocisimile]|uniref:tetrahydrofolate synthase n=1 Tax=Arcanobacterium phocisimile TaxID=1302235 RepID=A0ABX7IHR3_9ACTO|nr:folylpolyglutamate synthase/dihydrofolate synthase family protein [Arcanobacterium phocisimile]QRV02673.1 bifunctional folylpolyglutamate synthase/dihydrofolate synthase [Arcanobacterium phocisimile]